MLIETAVRFERLQNLDLQGANSQVFLARDHQLQATLVVKEIEKAKIDAARYFDEAAKLYAARHPNVVDVLYASSTDTHVYIAMPQYACSIEALLRDRPLTVREVVRVGIGFLTGLHHIHVKKLVHFDIKPSNVLLDTAGNASLSDFGLCQAVDAAGLATPAQVYESHVAPEYLVASTSLSTAADIYQAGLTLYRMCTGTALWQAHLNQVIAALGADRWLEAVALGAFPSRDLIPPHIPNRLRAVIMRAIQPNPDDRFGSVLEMMNELAQVDEALDWQFTPMAEDLRWELTTDAQRWTVELKGNGPLADIIARRENLATGKVTDFPSLSHAGVKGAKVVKYVQAAIREFTPSS
ncbi:MAG: serine/threonine protein kinase [Gemmatimonadaceae bacterium]|nr:serine/threonine protein kinase [Gemmatimonadaceae bacterium]